MAERVGWLLRRSAVHRWRGSAHPNPAGFEPALLRAPCEGLAERVGFEPTEACTSPHFECGALDHYATSPGVDYARFEPAGATGAPWTTPVEPFGAAMRLKKCQDLVLSIIIRRLNRLERSLDEEGPFLFWGT